MGKEELKRLDEFIEANIPFVELKKAGFFAKDVRRRDVERIAARVCLFFGFQSIYEYNPPDLTRTSPTTMSGDMGHAVNAAGKLVHLGGCHIDIAETEFECPICTCVQDATDHRKFNNIGKTMIPVVTVKCKGCKRAIELYSDPCTGKLTVTEVKSPQ